MAPKAKSKPDPAQQARTAQVVYRINTLLHTMRAIERHEEKLCALMNELKSTGQVTDTTDEELRDLLEQMPAHEYNDDIEAIRTALNPS